jgi:hypothetical protein
MPILHRLILCIVAGKIAATKKYYLRVTQFIKIISLFQNTEQ